MAAQNGPRHHNYFMREEIKGVGSGGGLKIRFLYREKDTAACMLLGLEVTQTLGSKE